MKYKDYRTDSKIGKYLKEELLIIQNNKCLICEEEFKNLFNTHLDHDHKTGEIRGLLCYRCNLAMAIIDRPELKLKCENYKKQEGIKNILIDLESKIKLKREEIKKEGKEKRSEKLKVIWSDPEVRKRPGFKPSSGENHWTNKKPESITIFGNDFSASNWIITTPNGEILYIKNLRKFCIENNLIYKDGSTMLRNKFNYRGWTCKKVTSSKEEKIG